MDDLPELPDLPDLPTKPDLPDLPTKPDLPDLPTKQDAPAAPQFNAPEGLQDKLPIVVITLLALILIYLDNSGKLAKVKTIIEGASLNTDSAAPTASTAGAASGGVSVPPGGVAPAPVSTGNTQINIGGLRVTVPINPPLPSLPALPGTSPVTF